MKPPRPSRHAPPPRGPFQQLFDVRSLKGLSREIGVEATSDQCAAIAQGLGLPSVHSLTASFRLTPRAGDRVELDGRVLASVDQMCVVSLEPFETKIDQPVDLTFAPTAADSEPRNRGGRTEVEIAKSASGGGNDEQDDPPDPIVDDKIDLGAVAVEFMVLGLDPYPRKPGVHFDDMILEENDAPAPSAFAALARFKDQS